MGPRAYRNYNVKLSYHEIHVIKKILLDIPKIKEDYEHIVQTALNQFYKAVKCECDSCVRLKI